jgi:ribosomal protein L12E/L44/L45/RPP1/RPP2
LNKQDLAAAVRGAVGGSSAPTQAVQATGGNTKTEEKKEEKKVEKVESEDAGGFGDMFGGESD